jgi:hypothetical protein
MFDAVFQAAMIGAGATALLDVWSVARTWRSGAVKPDYAIVGRWLAYLPHGRFVHAAIAKSAPVQGEAAIGWTAHYLTGIAFAGALIAVWPDWTRQPTLIPALMVGIGSVAAPLLLMQPGMGLGIAASRAPNPRAARLRSLTTHTVFGIGLFASGWAVRLIEL